MRAIHRIRPTVAAPITPATTAAADARRPISHADHGRHGGRRGAGWLTHPVG